VNKKSIVLVTVAGLLLTLTAFSIFIYIESKGAVSNINFEKVTQQNLNGTYILSTQAVTQTEDVMSVKKVRDVEEVYKDIHLMANSVVIANHIWGKSEITEEKVNGLLLEVMASEYYDKKELIEIISRWKNGNFKYAAYDHNYVWDNLNGTIGEATKVNWSKVPKWAINKQAQSK
jgi:hypothetical protein